jgi:hypothetical protein
MRKTQQKTLLKAEFTLCAVFRQFLGAFPATQEKYYATIGQE